ncbi:hypothetical protein [Enterovirga sp.]|jgi:hypothetical protein|uniref:hypothetical protein n=1 Tax=Enterovirga sp. TaxID=2026350 RepID=UPI00260302A0|nr:hypothetical protein [Enterovirga sp.]MDB5590492.1 hypothetical protein [Enterovirga sp.]
MRRFMLLSLVALTPLLVSPATQAQAQSGVATAQAAKPRAAARSARRRMAARPAARTTAAGQYFIEFRSRHALSYGHSFVVHGRLNARGEVGPLSAANVAGFHPAGAGPELWTLGHVVPVASETGPSDGDLEEQYVSARFRVLLTEAEYRRVAAHIREKQQVKAAWHATLYNCNAWIGQIAGFMGLRAPLNHVMYPADFIEEMKRLNSDGYREPAART